MIDPLASGWLTSCNPSIVIFMPPHSPTFHLELFSLWQTVTKQWHLNLYQDTYLSSLSVRFFKSSTPPPPYPLTIFVQVKRQILPQSLLSNTNWNFLNHRLLVYIFLLWKTSGWLAIHVMLSKIKKLHHRTSNWKYYYSHQNDSLIVPWPSYRYAQVYSWTIWAIPSSIG